MNDFVITRRLAFLARISRRVALSPNDLIELEGLYRAYDMLAMRAYCARHGFKLSRSYTFVGGVKRAYLLHRKAAA